MNLGWEGESNGYYATHCLNPAKAYEYDFTYTWHFRIITYDKPEVKQKRNIVF